MFHDGRSTSDRAIVCFLVDRVNPELDVVAVQTRQIHGFVLVVFHCRSIAQLLGVFHDSRSTTKRTILRVQTTTNKSYALLKTVVLTNFLNKKLWIFPLRSATTSNSEWIRVIRTYTHDRPLVERLSWNTPTRRVSQQPFNNWAYNHTWVDDYET